MEERVRAGVLEQGTADLLVETGVGARLKREGLIHHGIELRFGGRGHRIDFKDLANGQSVVIYPQNKVVADLFDARQAAGGRVFVEAEDVSVHDFSDASSAGKPKIRFRAGGESHELTCDFIAGCDGFHGICRPSIPAGVLTMLRARLPVRLAGHPRRGAAFVRRAHLRLSRAGLRSAEHALAGNQPALRAVRAR